MKMDFWINNTAPERLEPYVLSHLRKVKRVDMKEEF
jgi:hypothetical protein